MPRFNCRATLSLTPRKDPHDHLADPVPGARRILMGSGNDRGGMGNGLDSGWRPAAGLPPAVSGCLCWLGTPARWSADIGHRGSMGRWLRLSLPDWRQIARIWPPARRRSPRGQLPKPWRHCFVATSPRWVRWTPLLVSLGRPHSTNCTEPSLPPPGTEQSLD